MNPVTDPLTDPAPLAKARLAVYQFLLAALDKPSPAQQAWLTGAEFEQGLLSLCERFSIEVPPPPWWAGEYAQFEALYIACFEVGLPAPPVVLLASHYNRRQPVPRTIHEHLAVYRWFGVSMAKANIEQPDHLLNELAFLVRLDELLLAGAVESESILRARADFLSRHAAAWPGEAARAARSKAVPPVYQALLALLAAAVEQDRALSASAVAAGGGTKEEGPP